MALSTRVLNNGYVLEDRLQTRAAPIGATIVREWSSRHTRPNAGESVGQTPWSARVPLDPLLARRTNLLDDRDRPTRRRPRSKGTAPRLLQVALGQSACA